MTMEISKTFVVKASPHAAWNFLSDPRRVARCLPGATITEQVDERTYGGTMTVKVGPVSATYRGTMRFEHMDPATRTGEIVAVGQDVRGKGGADMRMTSRLVERAPGETEVVITSQVNVMGVLAQFGRGMIQDVSDQMFQKFVDAARAELETDAGTPDPAGGRTSSSALAGGMLPGEPAGAAPIEVISFGSVVVARAGARAARRPVVWVGALIILLVIYWLWRP